MLHCADEDGNAICDGELVGNTHSKEGADLYESSSIVCISHSAEAYLDDDGEIRLKFRYTNYTAKEGRTGPSGMLFGNGT